MTLIVKRHNNSVKLIGPLVCGLICFTTMVGLFNSMSHAMLWDGWLLLLVRILLFSWAVGMVLELLLEGVVNPHVVSAYLMAIGYNNWQKEQGKICFPFNQHRRWTLESTMVMMCHGALSQVGRSVGPFVDSFTSRML